MAYYRYVLEGGEFVIEGARAYRITFNGVQIGGAYNSPQEAIGAIDARRSGRIAGPQLSGVADPSGNLDAWCQGTTRYAVRAP